MNKQVDTNNLSKTQNVINVNSEENNKQEINKTVTNTTENKIEDPISVTPNSFTKQEINTATQTNNLNKNEKVLNTPSIAGAIFSAFEQVS